MSKSENFSEAVSPVLRLRPVAQPEEVEPEPWKGTVHLDGPMVPHPSFLREYPSEDRARSNYVTGITKDEYREQWKNKRAELYQQIRALKKTREIGSPEILALEVTYPPVDMTQRDGRTDDDLESALERYYVGAQQYSLLPGLFLCDIIRLIGKKKSYLIPGEETPLSMIERYGADWGLNARGIYYRHFYSPAYVTPCHNLWLPSLHDTDWNHVSEDGRRVRAEKFLKHSLDNERFKKSEYAWEADAWQDVFGLLREDPALAVDKHEYNTIKQKRNNVSCLLDGQPKFVKRIPDATFGLATFKPADYPEYPESLDVWSLDRDRLESLLLHRHCGLISDPHWGDVDLVFPFAVYEAKGWSGDPREARRQACSAGAVYLDMLDNLARKPGPSVGSERPYQTEQSCNNQVFALTSFGAHWHVLVGYKRLRLEKEHAGHEGLSKSVYVFQRIWSGRVVTKRKAWELLSLVDQIHSWGVTEHQDFVIQHLKAWHEFGKLCYANDFQWLEQQLSKDPLKEYREEHGEPRILGPVASLQLAGWVKNLTTDTRDKLRDRAVFHFWEARQRDADANKDDEPIELHCVQGDCGPTESPGFPLTNKEEFSTHCRQVHGYSDRDIAGIKHAFKELKFLEERPNEPNLRQMKRSTCGEPGPSAKRYRSQRSTAQGESDLGKGKATVIDLTDD